MQTENIPGVAEVLDALKREEVVVQAKWHRTQIYDLTPWDFLSFCREDLEDESERGRLNAVSNAKRTIACRVDEILTLSALQTFATKERWGLPFKLEVIKKLGCPAPAVLREDITKLRNLLEHEYRSIPDREEIRRLGDITELFLKATDDFVKRGYLSFAQVRLRVADRDASERYGKKRPRIVDDFRLEFDREDDTVGISFCRVEEISRRRLEDGWVRYKDYEMSESVWRTYRLIGCAKEDILELQRLIREKSRS